MQICTTAISLTHTGLHSDPPTQPSITKVQPSVNSELGRNWNYLGSTGYQFPFSHQKCDFPVITSAFVNLQVKQEQLEHLVFTEETDRKAGKMGSLRQAQDTREQKLPDSDPA